MAHTKIKLNWLALIASTLFAALFLLPTAYLFLNGGWTNLLAFFLGCLGFAGFSAVHKCK